MCPAGVPDAPRGAGGAQGRAAGARLGCGIGRRPQRGRGLRGVPAAQDRRSVRQKCSSDRTRGGLPARGRRRLTVVDDQRLGGRRSGAGEHQPARPWGWWRRRSLRARLTLITSAGLAVALAAAALLLANALRLALGRGLDGSGRQGAAEVAALINQDRLPDPVPGGSGTITIQVLDAQGRITDVSEGADRLVPLLPAAQARTAARTGQGRMLSGPPLGMPSPLRVVAVGANDGQVVVAAVSFAQASDSIATVAKALFIGTPLLFGLVALAIWLVTGYTLRPIAGLRRGAADVTQTGIPRHLPGPPARDEVRSLAVTLNDMLSRLADAQPRQRYPVSATAHELRSPIASIRAQLEVALDHPDGLDWTETARDVHADTLRLARLAAHLLLLARPADQPLRRPPVDP